MLEIKRVRSCIHGCRYYCVTRAQTPTPTDGLSGAPCPVNHFCPLGSRSPAPCSPGSYMPHTRGEKCQACPEGEYCVSGEKPQPCPQGELRSLLNVWFVFDFPKTADSDLFFLFQGISVPKAQLFQLLVQQGPITLHKGRPPASPVLKGKRHSELSVVCVSKGLLGVIVYPVIMEQCVVGKLLILLLKSTCL